jgi:hypothetical protein
MTGVVLAFFRTLAVGRSCRGPSALALGLSLACASLALGQGAVIPGVPANPYAAPVSPLPGPAGGPPPTPYFDLDAYQAQQGYPQPPPWTWQVLPDGLIYKSYLANTKESRLGTQIFYEQDAGWTWDYNIGGKVGLLRYGTDEGFLPSGFQWDVEGSAQGRSDIDNNMDFHSVDFRGGTWLTYGAGCRQFKLGYYHLSSHLGDEFLLANPGFPRLNFARDVIAFGISQYFFETFRVYGEIGYAFYHDVSEPLEFQAGVDWAPVRPTGFRGAPFLAANVHLRQELDYSGNFTAQLGWAWVGDYTSHMLRIGAHYYNGLSNQYSFYQYFEQQIGLGVWYDY